MSEKQINPTVLIVQQQIKKFYIFDISPANSNVQDALKNGQ
ncbi:hypothetical protein, partial [Pseudomonas syringae group genomosp. 7]